MLRTVILKKCLTEATGKTAHRRRENSSIPTPITNRDITISKIIITNTPTADGRGVEVEGAATNIAGEEAADADTATAVADTEAAAAVVTGALGGAAGAGEEEAGDGTTTGKIKPPAKSKRRNSDFEWSIHVNVPESHLLPRAQQHYLFDDDRGSTLL